MSNRNWATAVFTAIAVSSVAQGYYTIDTANQWLCKVNVSTGQVSYVGPANNWGEPAYYFGYAADTSSHLAFHQGKLYALTHWRIGWPQKIAIVSCYGGNAGSQVGSIFVPLYYLSGNTKIGGLDSTGSDLVMTWGDVSDTGACRIGSVFNFPSWGPLGPPDSDGYMYADGMSWAIDVRPNAGTYELYANTLAPLLYWGGDLLGPYGTNPTDLASVTSSRFVAMSDSGLSLVHISKLNGQRISVVQMSGYLPGAHFAGIAYVPKPIPIKGSQHG